MKKGKILTGILLVSVAALTFVACGKKTTKTNNKTNITTKTAIKTTSSKQTTKTNKTTKADVISDGTKVYRLNDGFINVTVEDKKVDTIIIFSGSTSAILKPIFKNNKIIAFDMYNIFANSFQSQVYTQLPISYLSNLFDSSIDMFYDGDDFVIRNAAYISTFKSQNYYGTTNFKGITDIKVSSEGEISANVNEVSINDKDYRITNEGFEFNVHGDSYDYKFVVDYLDEFNYSIEQFAIDGDDLHKVCTITSVKQTNGDVLKKESREVISSIVPISPLSAPIGVPISGVIEIDEESVILDFENGKVVNINRLLPNGSIADQTTLTYNSDGLLASISGESPFDGEYTTSFSYNDKFNLVGVINDSTDGGQSAFEYDSKNRLLKETMIWTNSSNETIYSYDNQNRISGVIYKSYDNDVLFVLNKLDLTYGDGFVSKVEESFYDFDDEDYILDEVTETDFNANGTVKFTSTLSYKSDGSVSNGSKNEYIYDANNKRIGQKSYRFTNRWELYGIKTTITNGNTKVEHSEFYNVISNQDYLVQEVDVTSVYDELTNDLASSETINKSYAASATGPVLTKTLKNVSTYTDEEKISQDFILKDGEYKTYNYSKTTYDSKGRTITYYFTMFDQDTLAFKSGTSNDYEYTIEDDHISVKKTIYTHTSYATDYSPSNRVLDRVEKYDIDANGNRIGDLTTLYYDEIDRLARKEVYNGTYTDTYEYSYDSEYVKEVFTSQMSPDITENYYYNDLTEDNLLETVRIVRQSESESEYKDIYQTFYTKFNPVIGAKIGEDNTYYYNDGLLVREDRKIYTINVINEDHSLDLNETLYITIYGYDTNGREITKTVYKNDFDNLFEKYTYTYDEDTDRKDGLTYEWHSSGIVYTGEGIYQYQDDRNYLMDIKIYKKCETTQFEERAYYYQDGLLTREIHVYETNRSDTFYGTLFGKVVPTDASDESESVNGKYLIKTTLSVHYDFYGNAVMVSQTVVQDQYENEVDLSDLESNTLLGSVERITYFYDNDNNKFTSRISTKYDADGNKIKETIIQNTFSGTSSYDRIELVTNYGDDETVLSVEETKTKRDYESDGLLDGYYKTFTDYTTTPETVTTYYYEAGEWIPVM